MKRERREQQAAAYRLIHEPRPAASACRLLALRRAPLPFRPRSLRKLIARLSPYPAALLAAAAANAGFGAMLNARKLPAARGRVIAIEIRDMGLTLLFALEWEGVVACHDAPPDVTISADARDFLALARREEDADTLFFKRRLVMEGDTELALLIRNTLEAIDFRSMKLPRPARVLDAIALQLRAWR